MGIESILPDKFRLEIKHALSKRIEYQLNPWAESDEKRLESLPSLGHLPPSCSHVVGGCDEINPEDLVVPDTVPDPREKWWTKYLNTSNGSHCEGAGGASDHETTGGGAGGAGGAGGTGDGY